MSMDITVRSSGPVVVLGLDGNINHETLGKLSRTVDRAIGAGCNNIILCLQNTKILLSSGIGFFVDVHDMAEAAGGSLMLVNVPKEIQVLLKLVLLDDFFGEMPSLADALKKFGITESQLEKDLPEGTRAPSGLYTAALMPRDNNNDDSEAGKDADGTSGSLPPEDGAANKPFIKPPVKKAPPVPPQPVKPPAKPVTPTRATGRIAKENAEGTSAGASAAPQTLSKEEIESLVHRHLPGRKYVDIIDYFVAHQHSSALPADLAKALKIKEKEAKAAMQELVKRHLLKHIGGGLYNYAPEADVSRKMEAFFRLWHSSTERSRLLIVVLSCEK